MHKTMRVVVGLLLLGLLVTGCSVEPSKIDKGHAKDMSEKITYFRDVRTGLCFATIASRKSFSADQTGLGLTRVDCAACADLIVNQQKGEKL